MNKIDLEKLLENLDSKLIPFKLTNKLCKELGYHDFNVHDFKLNGEEFQDHTCNKCGIVLNFQWINSVKGSLLLDLISNDIFDITLTKISSLKDFHEFIIHKSLFKKIKFKLINKLY